MNTFGGLMKALRLEAGITAAAIAAKIRTTRSQISAFERGKSNPPSEATVLRLYGCFRRQLGPGGLGATPDDLVELAWVEKAPKRILERLRARIAGNPLARAVIRYPDAKAGIPEVVPGPPAAAPPAAKVGA